MEHFGDVRVHMEVVLEGIKFNAVQYMAGYADDLKARMEAAVDTAVKSVNLDTEIERQVGQAVREYIVGRVRDVVCNAVRAAPFNSEIERHVADALRRMVQR